MLVGGEGRGVMEREKREEELFNEKTKGESPTKIRFYKFIRTIKKKKEKGIIHMERITFSIIYYT